MTISSAASARRRSPRSPPSSGSSGKAKPGKLAGFAVSSRLATTCDLLFPFASARLVEALANGPTEEGVRRAVWGYGFVALVTFIFYFARNTGVRFWIPFAAHNMQAIVSNGFRDVQRFSSDCMLTILARPCGASRAPCGLTTQSPTLWSGSCFQRWRRLSASRC